MVDLKKLENHNFQGYHSLQCCPEATSEIFLISILRQVVRLKKCIRNQWTNKESFHQNEITYWMQMAMLCNRSTTRSIITSTTIINKANLMTMRWRWLMKTKDTINSTIADNKNYQCICLSKNSLRNIISRDLVDITTAASKETNRSHSLNQGKTLPQCSTIRIPALLASSLWITFRIIIRIIPTPAFSEICPEAAAAAMEVVLASLQGLKGIYKEVSSMDCIKETIHHKDSSNERTFQPDLTIIMSLKKTCMVLETSHWITTENRKCAYKHTNSYNILKYWLK